MNTRHHTTTPPREPLGAPLGALLGGRGGAVVVAARPPVVAAAARAPLHSPTRQPSTRDHVRTTRGTPADGARMPSARKPRSSPEGARHPMAHGCRPPARRSSARSSPEGAAHQPMKRGQPEDRARHQKGHQPMKHWQRFWLSVACLMSRSTCSGTESGGPCGSKSRPVSLSCTRATTASAFSLSASVGASAPSGPGSESSGTFFHRLPTVNTITGDVGHISACRGEPPAATCADVTDPPHPHTHWAGMSNKTAHVTDRTC